MAENNLAEYLFHQGTNYRAYEYLGSHITDNGTVFRTWAPNADMVYVTGDFNDWGKTYPMKKITLAGIWEAKIEKGLISEGGRYKFIVERNGKSVYKSDPYAFHSETLGNTASLVCDVSGFDWHDGEYLKKRKKVKKQLLSDKMPSSPINIYEVHLGSWKRHPDGSYLTYRELADELSAYIKEMGYTHIEIMPISEHPFDGSWGYQICSYYAPTSRFGTPEDFMYFVDVMHGANIGVIMDWVPAHFPKDEHGLCEFDGGPLYEFSDRNRMELKSWGTRCFDVGRNEVKAFLISNACFWAENYHIDGLRVDAVASMLYLDYDRRNGEWTPNRDGGNISYESVEFFKSLNGEMKKSYPDVFMIAEESTAFPNITKQYGLGFNFKWNMGWMNDTLSYIQTDTYFRCSAHNKMTFAMTYACSENYILPISHDEVVHGKKSLIDKMFGSYEQKFNALKTFDVWMYTHPGKKLTFMGNEFAQFREWDCQNQLEWFMLDYPNHRNILEFTKRLNHFYLKNKELWQNDCSYEGFNWLIADNAKDSTYAYERISESGRLICVFNFSSADFPEYNIPVSEAGKYREVFTTGEFQTKKTYKTAVNNGRNEITIALPSFSAYIYKRVNSKK